MCPRNRIKPKQVSGGFDAALVHDHAYEHFRVVVRLMLRTFVDRQHRVMKPQLKFARHKESSLLDRPRDGAATARCAAARGEYQRPRDRLVVQVVVSVAIPSTVVWQKRLMPS